MKDSSRCDNNERSVGVDEAPLAYGAFTKGATLDLERVEVLKGPRAFCLVSTPPAAPCNDIAAEPTRESEADGRLSVGRFNRVEAEVNVSRPR